MKDVHVVSFSGGKDSTAMLLRMLELKMPVDDIVFCDTGAEFPAMYEHIRKVEKYIHRPITWLKWEHSYEWYLLEKPCKRKISEFWNNKKRKENIEKQDVLGYSFAGPKSRWCTRLKVDAFNEHEKKYNDCNIIEYIGIAADEPNRIKDKNILSLNGDGMKLTACNTAKKKASIGMACTTYLSVCLVGAALCSR